MTKQELRRLYLKKRRSLTDPAYQHLNLMLCNRFFETVDLSRIKVLHMFLPIVKNKEPDTWPIINQLKAQFPAIRISIPKVLENDSLSSYYYENPDQLTISAWGIPEPTRGTITDPQQIDAVLIPLLAFDKQGHRVGYGKGYYDKFLKSCRSDCSKIGLSFFPPETRIKNLITTDLPLDKVITPEEVYTF
jgi:5-formyltetrahydrofolate cyclo-ligase